MQRGRCTKKELLTATNFLKGLLHFFERSDVCVGDYDLLSSIFGLNVAVWEMFIALVYYYSHVAYVED